MWFWRARAASTKSAAAWKVPSSKYCHAPTSNWPAAFEENGVFYVKPDSTRINQDIAIPPQACSNAKRGQMVVVSIEHYPDHKRMAVGRVVEILGDHLDPGMEIDVAVRNHGIPWQWPQDVQDEAAALSETVLEKDKRHRVDVRHLPLVTIDGEENTI